MAPNIPKEQWAQVIESDGVMKRKMIPVATPGPQDVLVHITYTGVCHTDLHALNNDWPLPRKTPLVGGHEGAGIVVAKGDLVANGQGVDIGDMVGIQWLNSTCKHCSFCMQAQEMLCPDAQLSGYTVDGTFQQYAVANAAHVAKFPKGTQLDKAAPILCAGLTVYTGLKVSETRPGQFIAIVGAGGGLGSLAIQYAKAMGMHVIAIDGGSEKKESCMNLGADTYVDYMTSKDLVADVRAASPEGLGPHGVLLLAPMEKPFQQATGYVRSHGTVVCIGLPAGAKVSMPVFDTVVRMVQVKGSYVGNRQDMAEALDFFTRGLVKAPIKVVGMSEIDKVFGLMRENKVVGRYVLDTSR
ncbi:putative alcohol dehydrogenase [Podospora australis]|uniref:alcohol dehydrogenase n=1 Tax=Podospora australis TaxID=1536484 RepID=A0AAN6WKT6_9PEZI|nr:putative alcohol dehydrogenase [Podospora australis]